MSKDPNPRSLIFFRLLMALPFLMAIVLVVTGYFHPDRYDSLRDSGTLFRLTPEDILVEELPSNGAGTVRSYTFLCPQIHLSDECLAVNLAHQFARIELDGETVYLSQPSEAPHIGRSPGFYWALVPLQTGDAGKEVRLTVENVYPEADTSPFIVIADKGDLILSSFQARWKELTACLLCIIIGLLYMFAPLMMRFNRRDRYCIFYLGAFTELFGLYRLVDFSVSALYASFIGANPRHLSFIALSGYILVPLLLDRFMAWVYEKKLVYRWMSACAALLPLTLLTLQLLGFSDLREHLLFVTIYNVLNILLLMLLSVLDIIRNRDGARRDLMRYLYLLMALASLFDLWNYFSHNQIGTTEATLYMVLLHALVRGIYGIRKAYRERAQLQQMRFESTKQRLTLLMSQIKPHFIYNTMNTIYGLCDQDPGKAKQVIHDFSRFLRLNAEALEQTSPIPFRVELEHTQYYLSIEMTRFPDRFRVSYDIPCDDFCVPALSLQPIVENAVRHGLMPKNGPGLLEIRTREAETEWVVSVRDNGAGFRASELAEDPDVGHIGISNVKKRLKLTCGGYLTVKSIPGAGSSVTMHIPKEAQHDNSDR